MGGVHGRGGAGKERIKNRDTASAPNKGAHSTRKVTPEAVVGGGNEDDDSDGNVSESSTVPTTSEEDELEDEEEEEDQLSSVSDTLPLESYNSY